jgi:hypothetical protein
MSTSPHQVTHEQSQILNTNNNSFRIMAGAGSGKTTTLTLYVRGAIQSGRVCDTDIMFITFTRLASYDIKRKIQDLIPGANICCGTFHKVLLVSLMKSAQIALPDPVHLFDGCMERNVEYVLELMRNDKSSESKKLYAHLRTFRMLVVDEFQDLDSHQFEFIREFRRIVPDLQIIAIGDLAQNIYRFRGTSNEFMRRLLQSEIVPELDTFFLRTNFRSSPEILAAVNFVFSPEIADGHIQPMIPFQGQGIEHHVKPKYYVAKRKDEYEQLVVETLEPLIERAKLTGKSIVIIVPVMKCSSFTHIHAMLCCRQEQERDQKQTDFHIISKEDATSSIVEITYNPRHPNAPVQLSTIHASKGLEWDIVCLVNIDDDSCYRKIDEGGESGCGSSESENENERKNLLYVAMTRAREELILFGNSPRHRLLARHSEETLKQVMDIVVWGEAPTREPGTKSRRPAGVSKLVKSLCLHPDLYNRVVACSEHIVPTFVTESRSGLCIDDVYAEMKLRNREMEFGTFIDFSIKRALVAGQTLQDRILETLTHIAACPPSERTRIHLYSDHTSMNSSDLGKLIETLFEIAGTPSKSDIGVYAIILRLIAAMRVRNFRFRNNERLRELYRDTEYRLISIASKPTQTVRELYIMSQSTNFVLSGALAPILSVDAPENLYMGLPAGFDEFATASVLGAAQIVRDSVASAAATASFLSDVPVETESLLYGEIDLMTDDLSTLIEIKCSAAQSASGLRGSANCVNLLQMLAYVAIGRHSSTSSTSLNPTTGVIVNPLTASWERYDLTTWSRSQSAEFLECFEELRDRVHE